VLCPCVTHWVLRKLDAAEVLHWSLSSPFNHIASHVATAAPRYSASVLDSATVGCFLLLHAIAALPRVNAYRDVDRRSAALPAQSSSV
jgi:hypothetical protein